MEAVAAEAAEAVEAEEEAVEAEEEAVEEAEDHLVVNRRHRSLHLLHPLTTMAEDW